MLAAHVAVVTQRAHRTDRTFWDTFDGVTNWSGTWSNDLPLIAALGANTIRVYSFLNTQLPPAPATQAFTHTDFLDACYENGLSVLVGIPLPTQLFDLNQSPEPSAAWWTSELQRRVFRQDSLCSAAMLWASC